jgi:hypothetical protein
MFYVLQVDHRGDFQSIMSKWKTLQEAKLNIENEKNDIIRVGRVGYMDGFGGRTFVRVIVESEVSLREGEGGFIDGPDEFETPEQEDKFFGDVDRVLHILQKHIALFSEWGDSEYCGL